MVKTKNRIKFRNHTKKRTKKNTKKKPHHRNTKKQHGGNEIGNRSNEKSTKQEIPQQNFKEIEEKLDNLHTVHKDKKPEIYKEIASLYIEQVCGNKEKCEIPKENSEEHLKVKAKIRNLIKQLEHPPFVARIQQETRNDKDDTQIDKEDTRKLLVEMLKKYITTNYIGLDETITNIFPDEHDVYPFTFPNIPDRIRKQTNITLSGYRSELDTDDNQKFGKMIPTIDVTYPNGFFEQMMGSILDVENFITANSSQGDKSRTKQRDNPVLKENMHVTEHQYYPSVNTNQASNSQNIENNMTVETNNNKK